jgi:hypothetical protein
MFFKKKIIEKIASVVHQFYSIVESLCYSPKWIMYFIILFITTPYRKNFTPKKKFKIIFLFLTPPTPNKLPDFLFLFHYMTLCVLFLFLCLFFI